MVVGLVGASRHARPRPGPGYGFAVSGAQADKSPSELIDARIRELDDWRGATLARLRSLIKQADPEAVEEWKWVKPSSGGTAVWSHDCGICTGEVYKSVV